MRRLRNAATRIEAPRRPVRDHLPRAAAGLGLALLFFSSLAAGQIATGQFSPASAPFISPFGGGVLFVAPDMINVDQDLDGIPDVTFNLLPELLPSSTGAFNVDYRLSPTEQILSTVKTPGSSGVPGCGPSDALVYFHRLGTPPNGITALNPGGACMPGPIAIGPLYNDLSRVAAIRTAIVVGVAPPVPGNATVLWVDLFNGGSNKDTFNYRSDVEPTIGGILFAPSGNAAYIQHGSGTAFPKYSLIDLCVSPIAGAGSVSTGDLPPGIPSAFVIPGGSPGTFLAEVRVNGTPLLNSRITLSTCQTGTGPPPMIVVTDAGDTLHNGTGGCAKTGTGICTLRDAITFANRNPGSKIHFNIPGSGAHTITPATSLPSSEVPTILDGYSQPGASPNTNGPGLPNNAVLLIEIDGSAGRGGLSLNGGNSAIRGFVMNRNAGIFTGSRGGDVIAGNFIGTDRTGMIALPNNNGIGIAGPNTTIGGAGPADRNVISGNLGYGIVAIPSNVLIEGNFIGTNAAGTAALGNDTGISLLGGSVVGGITPTHRNLISGNTTFSIVAGGSGNTISGNFIGVDVTGTTGLGNANTLLVSADNTVIGGTTGTTPGGACTGACNVISGPGRRIFLAGAGNFVQGNMIGLNAAGTSATFIRTADACITVTNASNTTIGGTSASARNVIAGCFQGVFVSGSPNTTIAGNFLGTDTTGMTTPVSLVPLTDGLVINGSDNSVIGGTAGVSASGPCTGACNVIVGNEFGIVAGVGGDGNSALRIEGNRIGTGADGVTPLPNVAGIQIGSQGVSVTPAGNTIGGSTPTAGNVIANNGRVGILIEAGTGTMIAFNTIFANGNDPSPSNLDRDGIFIDGGSGTTVTKNSIFSNTGLGIDLPPAFAIGAVTPNDPCDADTGPNNLQNFPVLTSASSTGGSTAVQGMLDSTSSTTFTIDFYASPSCSPSGYGEGKTYLGSTTVTTNGSCIGNFNVTLPVSVAPGSVVTATATEPAGSTSEFSQCAALSGGSPVPTQIFTLTPCRVLDTRNPNGPLGGPAITVGPDRTFVLAGHCGIPITAKALSINVTITQPTAQGDLRIYPGGSPLPLVSAINYRPGQTRANNAIAPLGPAGDLLVHCDQASGTVHLIIDVNGYFQ